LEARFEFGNIRLAVAIGPFRQRDSAEMLPVSATAITTDIASKRSIGLRLSKFLKYPSQL
jgi:hypothetical protein